MYDCKEPEPECLGEIKKWYCEFYSASCPYTALCVLIVMAELIRAGLLRN